MKNDYFVLKTFKETQIIWLHHFRATRFLIQIPRIWSYHYVVLPTLQYLTIQRLRIRFVVIEVPFS